MQQNKSFITGSYYQGIYNTATNDMDSYGYYTFPDGSTYQGHFRRGVFHGVGQYELAAPYKMKFKVVFDFGRLIKIEKLEFDDGLRFNCNIRKHAITTDNWKYLTRNNRLYPTELLDGAQPVGPNSLLTATENPEIIPDDTIDAGEGFYNRETGFIVNRKEPLTFKRFACNPTEVKSILKQYRVSDDLELVIPDEEDCEKIFRLNRKELALINSEYECPCEADNKPTTRVKDEDEHSWSTISPSSLCDEDVRISDIVANTRIANDKRIFNSVDSYDEGLMHNKL